MTLTEAIEASLTITATREIGADPYDLLESEEIEIIRDDLRAGVWSTEGRDLAVVSIEDALDERPDLMWALDSLTGQRC